MFELFKQLQPVNDTVKVAFKKGKDIVFECFSTDKDQLKNYSKIFQYLSYYKYQIMFNIAESTILVLLEKKKDDFLED